MAIKQHLGLGQALGVTFLLLSGASCSATSDPSPTATPFPESLNPIDEGYPTAGDPCRSLGPSDAVKNWSDDYPDLVGCPSEQDARGIEGTSVGIVDGYFIVAVRGSPQSMLPNDVDEGAVPSQ